MASLKARVTAAVDRLRERYAWFDHAVRTVQHYGTVNGNAQAGAVTYFGFLSVFPILALAFFVIGRIAGIYPQARVPLVQGIDDLLPGVIGTATGQISLSTIEGSAAAAGLIGLVGLLYSGLGWLSAMRQALEAMFVVPRQEFPNPVLGKLRDLGALLVIGLILLLSVGLTSVVTGFTGQALDLIGIDPDSVVPAVLLNVLGRLLGIAASFALLLTMFKLLLVESHVPRRAMQSGALLGAVGFELLKLAANVLLGGTKGSPAFQAFGVALIVVVWIYYFSRLVMYAAAWSYTAPLALEQRTTEATRAPGVALRTADDPAPERPGEPAGRRPSWVPVASALALVGGLVARSRRRQDT